MSRVVLDTNVIVGPMPSMLRDQELSVSSVTYAELEAGTLLASAGAEKAHRVHRLAKARETYGTGLPFDDRVAASFGLMAEAVSDSGRSYRARTVDLMIAATAHAHGAALMTHNVHDFRGLEAMITVLDASSQEGGGGGI